MTAVVAQAAHHPPPRCIICKLSLRVHFMFRTPVIPPPAYVKSKKWDAHGTEGLITKQAKLSKLQFEFQVDANCEKRICKYDSVQAHPSLRLAPSSLLS